jgi:ATP-dependent Clp protease adaptor protein ClpS
LISAATLENFGLGKYNELVMEHKPIFLAGRSPVNPFASDTVPTPTLEPEVVTRQRLLPPYNVILENDDHHSMDFVVEVLRKVFGFDLPKSIQLMMTAHETGHAIVWTGSKEVAELKAEQMSTYHEVRESDKKNLGALGVRIEPAE